MFRQPDSLLSILIVVGIASFASNWVAAEEPAAVTKRPNVLLIVADDK
ncbi:hypothetical protein ETAA8_44310 [Anatilimnocola aggregata]|uniref:Uncharacterized protein n=1 Tax=Anatilimnocola aggregata TaxID=2528021 RepID=A0A517YGK0_9BACT|nr:hypothetical protein [Anatilimnocola aggregata]QDU29322.1 hypothetical protein ETAA8_44310 [Anatilimnocola aggregata]